MHRILPASRRDARSSYTFEPGVETPGYLHAIATRCLQMPQRGNMRVAGPFKAGS